MRKPPVLIRHVSRASLYTVFLLSRLNATLEICVGPPALKCSIGVSGLCTHSLLAQTGFITQLSHA